ncbi:uncharacterized protein LOC122662888 [Telopea speciosissima]|uniref:uncharacterized protein LOC122662888 n=1 Tax=Telopea speciosissima TaxID=54955 RepID=UPI001CC37FAE|nr:uncharacterized protein LOC122662888 [Telopea speciosissima]
MSNDNWVPTLPGYKIQSAMPTSCQAHVESDLIDSITRTWRRSLLQLLFCPEEMKAIQSISLSMFPRDDKLVWGAAKNGLFSVKSTHHMLSNMAQASAANHASISRPHKWDLVLDKVRNRIWNVDTLPKIKAFMWRACADGLPTGEGLHTRKIPVDPNCHRCGGMKETSDHILLSCCFARAVWFGSSMSYIPPTGQDPSFLLWLQSWEDLFRRDKKLAKESLARAAFICWYIWRAHNDYVFGTKEWTSQEVILVAESAFLEYHKASAKGLQHNTTTTPLQPPHVSHWFPPPTGFVKVNYDAALKQGSLEGGIGLVFRSDVGRPLHALSAPLNFTSALQGETLAIRMAIAKAATLGITHLVVESDCKEAILYLQGSLMHPSLEAVVILNDVMRLCNSFTAVSFSSIPRDLNTVADTLARRALSSVCMTDWPISTPWLQDMFGVPSPSHDYQKTKKQGRMGYRDFVQQEICFCGDEQCFILNVFRSRS